MMGGKRERSISELPVHIIHIIFCLLSPYSLAVAGTISKSWWRAYVSFPELYICPSAITRKANKSLSIKSHNDLIISFPFLKFDAIKIDWDKVYAHVNIDFVNKAFLRFQNTGLNLQKLTLDIPQTCFIGDLFVSTIEFCIKFATATYNLYELRLSYVPWSPELIPVMPNTLLANGNSLRVLTLTYCKFEDNFLEDYSPTTILYSLQKLTLSNVNISNIVFARLISCCLFLLELSLNDCPSITTLFVDSLSKLKKVQLENTFRGNEFGFEKIVIQSPQLECFHLNQFNCRKEYEVDLVSCRKSLEVLEISCWALPKSILREAQVNFSNFTRLKTLSLHCRNPLLEMIDLSRLKSLRDASIVVLQSSKFDDPSIRVLLGSFKSPNGEKNTFTIANVSMNCWLKKIRLLLSVLQNEKVVSLHIPLQELGKLAHKEIRVNPKLIKYRLEHLKLKFEADCNCKDIVDAVFSMCCIDVLTLTWNRTSPDLSKRLFQLGLPKKIIEDLLHDGLTTCCGDSKFKCWRHNVWNYKEIKGEPGVMKLMLIMEWPGYREKRKYIEEAMILAGPKIPGQCNVYDCVGLPCLN